MLTLTDQTRSLVRQIVPEELEHDEAIFDAYASAVWTVIAEPGDVKAIILRRVFGPGQALRMLFWEQEAFTSAFVFDYFHKDEERGHDVWDSVPGWQERFDSSDIMNVLVRAAKDDHQLLIPHGKHWPDRLDDLGWHALAGLWVKGNLDALHKIEKSVAITGTSASTPYGSEVTMMLAGSAVRDNITVISGGGYGIDKYAHQTAVDHEKTTIAVLPGGLDHPFPPESEKLLGQIQQRGLLLSAAPHGVAPTTLRCIHRARLLAALAAAVVVVDAGSEPEVPFAVAGYASDLDRPLGAVPWPITSPESAGFHRLIDKYGAAPIGDPDNVRGLVYEFLLRDD